MGNMFRCTLKSGGASGTGIPLIVTCSEDFAGKTITATDGTTTLTETCPYTSPYTVQFDLPNTGSWTISGVIEGQTYSETISVTEYQLDLVSDFNYKTWVSLGGLDPSDYASLSDVLTDQKAVRQLMTIHASVDYLASFNTVNANLETVINNDICAKWINLRDYALDTLYANPVIAAVMDEADKYGYGELCLMPQVPPMTSNTAPYGEASASGANSGYEAYKAFDGNTSTYWVHASSSGYIQYHFTKKIAVKKMVVKLGSGARFASYTLKGSNDGTNFTDLVSGTNSQTGALTIEKDVPNDTEYEYLRLDVTSNESAVGEIQELQFYAYAPKGCVPVMTSNSAPYGEAICSRHYSDRDAYKAFDNDDTTFYHQGSDVGQTTDYVGYSFTNPICTKKVHIRRSSDSTYAQTFVVEGSNDGTNWTAISDNIEFSANDISKDVDCNSSNYYLKNRLRVVNAGSATFKIATLQFYGRQLTVSVPVMTSDTAPFGEAIGGNTDGTLYPYKAFNNDLTTYWSSNNNVNGAYCGYDFGHNVLIKMVSVAYITNKPNVWKLQGYDGTDWVDLRSFTSEDMSNPSTIYTFMLDNSNLYSKFRALFTSMASGNNARLCLLQFYGLDYSEKEFEEGSNKKWLYDHGVELVELEKINSFSVGITKEDNDILFNAVSSSTGNGATTKDAIDVTNYSLLRTKVGDLVGAQLYVGIHTNKTPTWWSPTASSSYALENANLPNNLSLDISNVNGDNYPMVAQSYPSNGSKLTELWLE